MISFIVEDGSGVSNATSYVSVEEADDIAALNFHNAASWDALTTQEKQTLLIYVTRALDVRAKWNGEKANPTQALEWPRKDVVDRYNNEVSSGAVPYNVRWAVVELAKWNISSDKLTTDTPENVVSEVKLDTMTVKFADAANVALDQFKMPEIVGDLLKGYGTFRNSARRVTFGKVVRT